MRDLWPGLFIWVMFRMVCYHDIEYREKDEFGYLEKSLLKLFSRYHIMYAIYRNYTAPHGDYLFSDIYSHKLRLAMVQQEVDLHPRSNTRRLSKPNE